MFNKKDNHEFKDDKGKCIQCQYHVLIKEGKTIIESWDKKPPQPKRLVQIQHELAKLQDRLEQNKKDKYLLFCAEHSDLFDFLPLEIA